MITKYNAKCHKNGSGRIWPHLQTICVTANKYNLRHVGWPNDDIYGKKLKEIYRMHWHTTASYITVTLTISWQVLMLHRHFCWFLLLCLFFYVCWHYHRDYVDLLWALKSAINVYYTNSNSHQHCMSGIRFCTSDLHGAIKLYWYSFLFWAGFSQSESS